MNKPIKIKKEFKNLIRPLHRQEFLQLEENILRDGCLNPIITWNGFIVDGHNRYEICTKHNVEFNVVEMDFDSDEDVIAWICANQLGRRNISDETRKFLIGMQYESEKIINQRKNPIGNNQYSDEDDLVRGDLVEEPYSLRSGHRTAHRIGEENHVSAGTVLKYAQYTRALETIGAKEPELVPKILSGRYKISHKNVVKMSELPAEELKTVNRHLNRSRNPYFQYNQSRSVLGSNPSFEAQPQPKIKEMPEFDPDAEVTELTLTVPTWCSSIKRTQNNANLSIISKKAREKLTSVLLTLKESVTEMLSLIMEDE